MIKRSLSVVEAKILFLLWSRRMSGDGQPATAKAVFESLRLDDSKVSFATIKKALARLAKEDPRRLDVVPVARATGPAGPSPMGYRLQASRTITWPLTATIVLELYNFPEFNPRRSAFLAHCQSRFPSFGAERLEESLQYGITTGYVTAGDSERLTPTERVDEEFVYLQLLSKHSEAELRKGSPEGVRSTEKGDQ